MIPRLFLFVLLTFGVVHSEHFIRIQNGEFVDGCDRFLMVGWNQWEVIESGAGAPDLVGALFPPGKTGPKMLRDMMDAGEAAGFNTMRAWAHTVSEEFALQTAPGEYNEGIFRGFDYVLDEARKHGIRLILSFTDNWPMFGGADEYVRWSSTAETHEDFYTDAETREMYKNHVKTIIQRKNTINGRVYGEDPTILGWNLMNEPRCQDCPKAIQDWIEEMAPYVKSLDSNHLLTVGQEGFYSTSNKTYANPQGAGRWPEKEGQDFINNHSPEEIDFLTIHSWVDNWEDVTETFQRAWIREHVADAEELGKPLILEEFGKIVQPKGPPIEERDLFFEIVFDEVRTGIENGPLKGALFWQWYDDGQLAPPEEGGGSGRYGVYQDDEAFSQVVEFAEYINTANKEEVNGCRNPGPSVEAPPSCEKTLIDDTPGTGYEGVDCDIDINECVRGTAGCDLHAGCVNSDGGFECQCYVGYTGNGVNCEASRALRRLERDYFTEGEGQLACDEGDNIEYPVAAPGFVYDPTGSVDRNKFLRGKFGSRKDITLQDCKIACDTAEGCDSFAYNPTLKQCFLKKCPTKKVCQAEETICVSQLTGEEFSCGIWQTYYHEERFNGGRDCERVAN